MNIRSSISASMLITTLAACASPVPIHAISSVRYTPGDTRAAHGSEAPVQVVNAPRVPIRRASPTLRDTLVVGEERCHADQPDACFMTGTAYERGENGIPADAAHAEALYTAGCDAGSFMSCESLAMLVEDGRDGEADLRAMGYFDRACADGRGSLTACDRTGIFDLRPHPGRLDRRHAIKLLTDVCALGDRSACRSIPGHAGHGAPLQRTGAPFIEPSTVAPLVVAHRAEIDRCTESLPAGRRGLIVAGVLLQPGGVLGASVISTDMDTTAGVEACLLSTVRTWQFPAVDETSLAAVAIPVSPDR